MHTFACVLIGICLVALTSGNPVDRTEDDTEQIDDALPYRVRSAKAGDACKGSNHCKWGLRCMNSRCRKGDDTQPIEEDAVPMEDAV